MNDGELIPFKWYWPTGSSGAVPCAWHGFITISASLGRQYFEFYAISA
jgi:hypothetical protein